MFKTVVPFLLGLLLFLVYYLRDCTGFECSATNPIFPISRYFYCAKFHNAVIFRHTYTALYEKRLYLELI
jgi:hypothetical protein